MGRASKNIKHARNIARKFAFKVLTDKKASKSAKKMALKVYLKVNRKFNRRVRANKNRHINRRHMHSMKKVHKIHNKRGAHRAVHHLKRVVNVKSHISRSEIKHLSKNMVKKILKAASNVKAAHIMAKKFAIKILRNPKSSKSMKKMAIRVFRNLKRKINKMGKHAKNHFNQRHSRHHMTHGRHNTHGVKHHNAQRHHAAPRHHAQRQHNAQRHQAPRRIVKKSAKQMSITLKKNISPGKINKLSRAIAKKMIKLSPNAKIAKKLAKRFVMRVLRNPKATRSMKIMAIGVLKTVNAHKKNAHHVVHQRLQRKHQVLKRGINEPTKKKLAKPQR